jgi:drug/metabolite transporter (DMT)-like permease
MRQQYLNDYEENVGEQHNLLVVEAASSRPHPFVFGDDEPARPSGLVEPLNPVTQRIFAIFGGVSLFLSVLVWIAQAEMLQGVQAHRATARAIVLTFWIRTAFALMAIPMGIWILLRRALGSVKTSDDMIKFWPSWVFVKYAIGLNSFSFLCDVFWYNSLKETSVSVNTAVYNSLPVFVLILSVIFLKEKVTWRKSISVIVGLAGLIVISLVNTAGGNTTFVGILLVIVSTILFALYTVMGKLWNDQFFLDTSYGKKIDNVGPKQSKPQKLFLSDFHFFRFNYPDCFLLQVDHCLWICKCCHDLAVDVDCSSRAY